MLRSAKEAKKAKTEEKTYARTIDDALSRLQADPLARMELSKLKIAGFQAWRIAELVLLYCGGDPRDAEEGLKQVKAYATQLQDCVAQLNSVANLLEEVQKLNIRFRRVFDDDGLPEKMREFASVLLREAHTQKKGLQKMRLGSSDQAGRDWVLVYLAYLLSGVADSPSPAIYNQIATMCAAVTKTKPNLVSMGDRLRKSAERFLKAPNSGWVVDEARSEFQKQKPQAPRPPVEKCSSDGQNALADNPNQRRT